MQFGKRLPILFGEDLVGRLDPKADRKNRTLAIHSLVIEKPIQNVDSFATELARRIEDLAAFNDCKSICIERCNDKNLGSALTGLLS